MGATTFDAAAKNSIGGQGCLVHLVVHGQRQNYDIVKRMPEWEWLGLDSLASFELNQVMLSLKAARP